MKKYFVLAAVALMQFSISSYVSAQSHFNTCVSGTGENATVLVNESISPTIDGSVLSTGDEIAVFTTDGICAGVEVWSGSNVALTVWGDNSLTTEKDGLSANEQMSFVVWDASSQTEYGSDFGSVAVSYVTEAPYNGSGLYDQDAIYQLASLSASSPVNPVAVISANPSSGDAPLPVVFNGSASSDEDGSISTYSWDFGDGASASGSTANHTYSGAGTYTATLTVTDNDGLSDIATQSINVTAPPVNNPPVASFTVSPSTGTLPLTVSVDASASTDPDGSIASYAWVFGDGSTATGLTASNVFTEAGTYQVALTVTDNEGATATTNRTVTVQSPTNNPPVASISATPTSGNAPLTVNVNGSASSDSDGSIVSYAWDFGNGVTATGVASSTVFGNSGTYTVTLIVTDDDGATGTTSTTIAVGSTPVNEAPQASFTATPSSGFAPHTVSFNASSSTDSDGTITAYAWDYGDGTVGSGSNSSHTYTSAGSYIAILTVTDDDGATDTTQRTVTVSNPPSNEAPVAAFTASATSGNAPLVVTFDGSSSTDVDGTISSYEWDFGDGATATGTTPSHTFNNGTYTVVLTVTDNDGATDQTSQVISVSLPPTGDDIVMHLTFDESSGVNAADASGNSNVGVLQEGASFSSTEGILNGAVRFDGGSSYVDIADNPLLNQMIVAKRSIALWFKADDIGIASRKQVLFEEGGQQKGLSIYLFDGTLYVAGWNLPTTESGWTGTYLATTDIASGEWIHVALVLDGGPTVTSNALKAYVNGVEVASGDGSQVWPHNDDISVGGIDGNTWFHDNTNKSGQSHGFSGLVDDLRLYNYILDSNEVAALANVGSGTNQAPVARISTDVDSGPAPLTVNFDARGSSDVDGQIQTYSWAFGDGTTFSGDTATNVFSAPGTYSVVLTVADDAGGTDTATKSIVVTSSTSGAPPVAAISEDPVRTSTMIVSVDASESVDPDGSVASYSWDFGDGSTESGETAIHEYTTPGSYEITLTVTDDSDLSNVASHWTTAYNRLPQNTGTSLIGAAGNFDPGFADYTSDVLTIRSPAATSTDDHDIFRFVYETMTGDGSITARVADIQSTSEGATVGVTVRSHLTPAATMAAVVVTGDGQIRLENRTLSGLDKIVVAQETASVPVFIRLTRQGYTLRAFTSMDGSIWTSLGTLDIGMPETVFMGVTAQAENGLAFNSTLDYLLLETANSDLPDGFALSDAYPNPFNPSSQITLVVNEDQEISVEMYNVAGQLVQTLFKGEISANQVNEFRFVSTDNLSSGIYFFRVVGDSFAATRKVMLLK